MTMSAQEARTVLDLQPGYEKADLASAYRRLVRSIHPDLLVGSSEQELRDASDLLSEANLANEVLRRSLRINATDLGPIPADPDLGPASGPYAPPCPTEMPKRHWGKLFGR